MKKVFFDKEKKSWVLNELDDMYSFKYINIMTNEENNSILTWIKCTNHSEIGIAEDDRLYGVDLNGEEYLFVETYKEGQYYLYAKDNMQLERLVRDYNFVFVGETIDG